MHMCSAMHWINSSRCGLSAASQMLERLMWKNEVLAMFVTGLRTCCLAWMTLTLKAFRVTFTLKFQALLPPR
jgi:hypothetical protein